jgi:hypothetical protein
MIQVSKDLSMTINDFHEKLIILLNMFMCMLCILMSFDFPFGRLFGLR